MKLAPGPRGLPLVGSTFAAFADPFGFFERLWREHGDIVRVTFGPYVYHLVNEPDALRHVLVDNARNYKKGIGYTAFLPLLGDGLLTSEGDFWLRQRRLAQPAFHKQRVAGYGTVMTDFAERHAAGWRDGAVVELHGEMMAVTQAIVGKTLFDADVSGDAHEAAG